MPKPIALRELIRKLRKLGFDGPYSGGRHLFMRKGQLKVRIPNPHRGDISYSLLAEILAPPLEPATAARGRQAGISKSDWENLK